ncbi:MAG: hypothetical protein RL720_1014 [Actinomycetota bacterium]|jgi:uncharacterized membrane protein
MASIRGFDRVVNFSDAVVAIAITILVLPLVDEASNIGHGNVNEFLMGIGPQIYVFVLSFAVIAYYWFLHHTFFEQLQQIDRRVMLLNTLWLFGIVFIPFPTALIVDSNGPAGWATFIYMSSMLYLAIIQLAMKMYVNKHKNLLTSGFVSVRGYVGSQIIVGLLVLALIIAAVFPNIGLWALLLLWTTPLFVKPVKKLQRTS